MMWKTATAALSAAAALSGFASADPISNCIQNDVCYQVAVPASVASAGQGDIYYQMRASTRYSWVAMGQGTGMPGANIFVMYADGRGNVTVSPRAGRGQFMPQFDSNVRIRLLAGSGISSDGQTMVANFACSNCQRWGGGSMSLASTGANYIGAYLVGAGPENPTSQSATIDVHDNYASWQFDLARAAIATNANPYVAASTGPGAGNGVSTGPAAGSSEGVTQVQNSSNTAQLMMAHGVIMALVMVFLYPLGSLLMPLLGNWMVHGGLQMISFLLMWTGFGLGYVVSRGTVGFTETHTILGTVVVSLFGIQPFLGVAHHMHFRKTGGRGVVSHVHIWYGRILMALGVINGGLGLQLANTPRSYIIAYSVVAAVMFIAYSGAKAVGIARKKKNGESVVNTSDERSKEQATHSSPPGSYRQD